MKFIFFCGWGGGVGLGGQDGCDRRSEVFVKIQKEFFFWGGDGGGGGSDRGVRSWVGEGVGVARFGVVG